MRSENQAWTARCAGWCPDRRQRQRSCSVNRPAERKAILILLQHRPPLTSPVQKEIVGVESVVAEKLPERAVPGICPGFAHNIYIRAGATTFTGIIQSSLRLKLLNRIRRWNRQADLGAESRGRVFGKIVGIHSVKLEIVERCPGSVG